MGGDCMTSSHAGVDARGDDGVGVVRAGEA